MLQEYGKEASTPAVVGPPGLGVEIYFICKDALAIHDQALANGMHLKEPFVGNGMWVVRFHDPDGYRVSFEGPTDLPEGTTFSQWAGGELGGGQ
jgi:lactoylglutathione lyase